MVYQNIFIDFNFKHLSFYFGSCKKEINLKTKTTVIKILTITIDTILISFFFINCFLKFQEEM